MNIFKIGEKVVHKDIGCIGIVKEIGCGGRWLSVKWDTGYVSTEWNYELLNKEEAAKERIREVTMAEVCEKFGEEVKIKK